MLHGMPDFFFGRPYLNDYLYLCAERLNAKRYNCTNSIALLHPIHSPDYVKILDSAENTTAKHNKELLDKSAGLFKYSIKSWPSFD
jgi:hypothetical protein